MNKEKDIRVLNAAYDLDMLGVMYVEMISSDTLLSVEACDKTIELLTGFLEALPETKIEDKDEWKKNFEDGIEIAKKDKEYFEKQK